MSSKRAQEEKLLYNSIKRLFEHVVSPKSLANENMSDKEIDAFVKGFRYTKRDIKLRTPAIIKFCHMAQEKFPDLYGGQVDTNVGATLYCGGMQLIGDHIIKLSSLGIAAGIWIADVLTEVEKIDELNELLPEEFEYSSTVFFDAHHSNDIVERIAYMIENADMNVHYIDVMREVFALIPQEYKDRAVANYDKLAWDIFEIAIKEFYAVSEQKEELLRSLDGSFDFAKYDNLSFNAIQADLLEKQNMADRISKLDWTISTIFPLLQHYYTVDSTEAVEATPSAKKVFAEVNKLNIDNPYELCATFFMLRWQEDYRYWTMGPYSTVVSFAAKRLPWTGNLEYVERHKGTDIVNADMYSLNFSSGVFDSAKDANGHLNLSQLVYHLSGGGILPRQLNAFSSERMILEKNGVSEKQIDFIATTAALLAELDLRNEYYVGAGDFEDEEESKENEEQVYDVSEDTIATLNKLVSEGKERIKKVSTENRLIEEQRRKLQKDYDELKRLYNEEHRELVDLRNYVFNQNDNAQEESTNAELKIAYPYEAKHNIVVFGGHETWSKAIKPLFANVRFINRDTLPNPDMIKNADIVWVQANSIGHSKYYKILDVVRTYHIPLRYFAYASAEKCAEQIVIEDLK